MLSYLPYIWVGIILLAVVLEAATCTLVSIWFIPSAVIALVLSLFKVELWIQILTFIVLSALLLVFSRRIFKKALRIKDVATNADAVIGEKAVVTEPIRNLEARGQVKVKGQVWSARAADPDAEYEVGDVLDVVSIEGVKLICRK